MTRHISYSYALLPRLPSSHILWSSSYSFSAYHCCACMYAFSITVIWIPVHSTCTIVPCYRIHVIWSFPVNDTDIPVTGHASCWYAICGKPTSIVPVPGILFMLSCSCYIVPDSRYIVLRYQQSSGPVIMLPVSCTVVILVTLYTWYNGS